MDDSSSGNAGLMRRIVQLERERDELQRDVETLCMQQSGLSGSNDIVSRMQARRAAGFEQELEVCKQQLALQTKENISLQEEVADTYRAKGRVADAFKAALDKNKELEKEVKFYQSRMAGAFAERDKALVEVENLQSNETHLGEQIKELQKRLGQAKAECTEKQNSYMELQESHKPTVVAKEIFQKVVDRFWLLREDARENKNKCEDPVERAQILFEDDDANWTYGCKIDPKWEEECKTAELNLERAEKQLVLAEELTTTLRLQLEEELKIRKEVEEKVVITEAASMNIKRQLEEETFARKQTEEKSTGYFDLLAMLKTRIETELNQLQAQHQSLVTAVSAVIENEKTQILEISDKLLHAVEKWVCAPVHEETGVELGKKAEFPGVEVATEIERQRDDLETENIHLSIDTKDVKTPQIETSMKTMDDESKLILAQALQEKVGALLLLSQQEERHYLEAATKSALENQVTELKQKLAQVTGEKVSALMDLAAQRNEVHYLQEREKELEQLLEQHRSTSAGGRLLPATWSEAKLQAFPDDSSIVPALLDKPVAKTKQPPPAAKGYLKTWLRGLEVSSAAFRSSSAREGTPPVVKTKSQIVESNTGLARLLVENAALQERVDSVQKLAQSAHRLRMNLLKVATDLQGEADPASVQAAMDVVETVKTEARRLKVALGCSLPVSYQGPLENHPDDLYVVPLTEGVEEASQEQTNVALDSVSMAGIEIAELLLATSELQKSALLCRLELPRTA